jgi:hypothetical protein
MHELQGQITVTGESILVAENTASMDQSLQFWQAANVTLDLSFEFEYSYFR